MDYNELKEIKESNQLNKDVMERIGVTKVKIGDKVVTKNYSMLYDGKILTIKRIVEYNSHHFCYFKESVRKSENFSTTSIIKVLN